MGSSPTKSSPGQMVDVHSIEQTPNPHISMVSKLRVGLALDLTKIRRYSSCVSIKEFPLPLLAAEKFWGRIHLAISLVGRRSPLSLENKVILYKQILRPVLTYGSPVWGAAATTHMKKIQVIQNKILRVMTNAPWYVRNDVIHNDLHMKPITNYITKLSRNVFKSIESHDNPIIKAQTLFTYPHPKIKYAYSSTKWRKPLHPP
ncbi:probable RNA-directed DNA polymerase from transposon X-element [Trichonephila clavipes]|nr:probable RNA-directed DNA polymerase from transposon X-element [Trichonephila clavipes]